jgi:hypothetical protein
VDFECAVWCCILITVIANCQCTELELAFVLSVLWSWSILWESPVACCEFICVFPVMSLSHQYHFSSSVCVFFFNFFFFFAFVNCCDFSWFDIGFCYFFSIICAVLLLYMFSCLILLWICYCWKEIVESWKISLLLWSNYKFFFEVAPGDFSKYFISICALS